MCGEADELTAKRALHARLKGLDGSIVIDPTAEIILVVPIAEGVRARFPLKLVGLSESERDAAINEALETIRISSRNLQDTHRRLDVHEYLIITSASTIGTIDRFAGSIPLLGDIDRKDSAMRKARVSKKR